MPAGRWAQDSDRADGMRFLVSVAIGGLVMLGLAGTAQAQLGYDRPGGNYSNFAIRSGDPAACATRCEHDAHCRAWSFSYPRTKRKLATCWLKKKLPARVPDDCCVSGVRGAGVIEPRRGPVEYSIDRHGGDYKTFTTARDPAGASCRQVCEADARCRAWTYARPGYVGATARCYLKSKIPRPHRKPCCISGVVR
jgi:PAN domain